MKRLIITLAILMGLAGIVKCDDVALAAGLAQAGGKLAASGKTEQAEQTLYRALVYDDHCWLAYFELAKLSEKNANNGLACDLYFAARSAATRDEDRSLCSTKINNLNHKQELLDSLLNKYNSDRIGILKYISSSTVDHIRTSQPGPAGVWYGRHWAWNETVKINEDGTFLRQDGAGGSWQATGNSLTLKWSDYEPEIVFRISADEYLGKFKRGTLSLKRMK